MSHANLPELRRSNTSKDWPKIVYRIFVSLTHTQNLQRHC
jgi:hypothetical protein